MMQSDADKARDSDTPLANAPCFIETQFPVAKISMESYKERKAGNGQTLAGLGKWWGRKPLILVRAALLGLLMPASDNPEKDRGIFLKMLTMDREGLQKRKNKPIPEKRLLDELAKMPPGIRQRFLDFEASAGSVGLRKLSKGEKEELQWLVFNRLPYGEKMEYCQRPEQIDGPSEEAWEDINAHLDTHANNLPELVQELGEKRFGHHPKVGDAFCGGGSIPFEAARIGCDTLGTDLNPVSALLTWAAINIIGGGNDAIKNIRSSQEEVYDRVEKKVIEWGIEQNSVGWRADIFLYCVEAQDPETDWWIPLLPNLMIAESKGLIVKLIPDYENKRYEINIEVARSKEELTEAWHTGTVRSSRLYPPYGGNSIPIETLRKGIRFWEKTDIVPRPDDIFHERLYCVRWVETYLDEEGKLRERRHYRAPTLADLEREDQVLSILKERYDVWQETGFIPDRKIESGYNTDQPIRERGWLYWQHLFNARQLLIMGLLSEEIHKVPGRTNRVACLLGIGRACDWNSRLSRWGPNPGKEMVVQTFGNQALNTLYNYGCRGLSYLKSSFSLNFQAEEKAFSTKNIIYPGDARATHTGCNIWITDPPYADAVNYHELSEFFLAWYDRLITDLFPNWYSDSKRALAVKGNSEDFRTSMVMCYKRLTEFMPDNGLQIVMFTHQDASVWADLTIILWAAGLRVTSAWTIATETDSALKAGNYVQGTVLLVLRKRTETEPAFLDEINYQVEEEVRRQLDSMLKLEDDSDPNFGDADYQLAAYAAALRVLTAQPIDEIDPEKEILRERKAGEISPVEQVIRRAVKIACDHLIPKGLDSDLWKSLGPMERFYIKGLEVESHGEYRSGVYQELARGFGAAEYTTLLESTKANETRLKSASEFGKKMLGSFGDSESFADSLVRQCLFAVYLTVKNEETRSGFDYLHTELGTAYSSNRARIIGILDYLATLHHAAPMANWQKDSNGAALLAGAVRNEHV